MALDKKSTKAPAADKPAEKPKPPLSNDGRPATQKIARALPPGAEEALGGKPFAMPSAAPAPAEKPEPKLFGNPTFDPPSPDVIRRREIIATIKAATASLIAEIERTAARLRPRLEELEANIKDVIAKEDFDPKEVSGFLDGLEAGIDKLKKS